MTSLKLLLASALLTLLACTANKKDTIDDYHNEAESKKILAQVVRYNYYNEGIPSQDRVLETYNEKYEKVLPSFSIYKYAVGKDDFHCFVLYRLHHKDRYRAVGGRLKLNDQNRVIVYEEIFVTPLLPKNELDSKSDFLFDELVKHGKIEDDFLKMKQYVEWPNENQKYDTVKHEWILVN
jgi:hypothetical protein